MIQVHCALILFPWKLWVEGGRGAQGEGRELQAVALISEDFLVVVTLNEQIFQVNILETLRARELVEA